MEFHLQVLFLLQVAVCSVFCDLPDNGVRCYDCNYDPSHVPNHVEYNSNPGYQRCALKTAADHGLVEGWPCLSGTCFIRKDSNGLVYRGCADRRNLPWGTDTSASCTYQGHADSSLWWFCDGDRCNSGHFGDANVCPNIGEHVVDVMKADKVHATLDDNSETGYGDIMFHAMLSSENNEKIIETDEAEDAFDESLQGQSNDVPSMTGIPDDASDQFDSPAFLDYPPIHDESLYYYDDMGPLDIDDPPPPYNGPPALMNPEFAHHYQSLIPQPNTEHSAGIDSQQAGDDESKSSDHKSLKSWQPKKSADSPDSYHKSWQGDDFSVSYEGQGSKSHGKSDGNDEERKSGYGYTDHSKSGYSPVQKSEPPKKSTYDNQKSVPTKKSTYQHQKSVPSKKSKYDYQKSEPPKKSTYVHQKSVPLKKSTYDHQKSEPPKKSTYEHQKSNYDHRKSEAPAYVSHKSAPPKKSAYNHQKSGYLKMQEEPAVKSQTSPPKKSVYKSNPKSQALYQTKTTHVIHQKSNEMPIKSQHFPIPPLQKSYDSYLMKSGYSSEKSMMDYPAKSSQHKSVQSQKSHKESKSGYIPPKKSSHSTTIKSGPKSMKMPANTDYPPPKKSNSVPSKSRLTQTKSDNPKITVKTQTFPHGFDYIPKPFFNPPTHSEYIFPKSAFEGDSSKTETMPKPKSPFFPSADSMNSFPHPNIEGYVQDTPSHPANPFLPSFPQHIIPLEIPVPDSHSDSAVEPAIETTNDASMGVEDTAVETIHESPGQTEVPDMMSADFGDYWFRNYFRGDRSEHSRPATDKEDGEVPVVEENPCKSDCSKNPSGLFPHPARGDWFIQCGSGMDSYGLSCECCKPNYLRCPEGTSFDIFSGVCDFNGDHQHHG